ncbi:MAG TPA: hypothetical protein VLL52_10510 [Anaerolineae bacterium]|nr:hypothetical protein [Anaerolineae bacterium]
MKKAILSLFISATLLFQLLYLLTLPPTATAITTAPITTTTQTAAINQPQHNHNNNAACPSAVTGLTLTPSINSLVLTWDRHPDFDLGYKVWRSQTPYFTPGSTPLTTLISTTTSYRDQHNLMSTKNYYYYVEGLKSCDSTPAYSQHVAAFNYELLPGAPQQRNGIMSWAQTPEESGQRNVLTQWFAAPPADTYTLYRQINGGSWNMIATTSFAPDPTALADTLDTALPLVMSDLGVSTTQKLYDRLADEPVTAQIMAREYYSVALATGRGYLDINAPDGDLAYYISTDGTNPELQSVCVPEIPADITPSGFRQSIITPIPADLGVTNSSRPLDAEERFDWFKYQEARMVNGRVHMLWDKLTFTEPPTATNPLTCLNASALQVAGYNVYRQGPLTAGWELANPTNPNGNPMLVTIPADPPQTLIDEPYFFVDNLLQEYSGQNPADIFTTWDYRLCPVNWLGAEIDACSTMSAPVRELDNPNSILNPMVTVEPDHSFLTLEWDFYDDFETSTPVTFVVARHLTPTAVISHWQTISVIPFPNPINVTTTIAITDIPPISEPGRPYWYQIQVRDDAGNWSPPSSPVSGALYPREPLALNPINFQEVCGQNPELPLTLNTIGSGQSNPVMDARAKQAILYRSFDNVNWRIIERFQITNGSVTLTEDFASPVASEIYYRIELLDEHGNVSDPQPYCTVTSGHTQPVIPGITGTQTLSVVNLQRNNTDSTLQVVSTSPDVETMTTNTTTVNYTSQYTTTLEEGECQQLELTNIAEDGQQSPPTTHLYCHNNNFMNTNRQLTNLGPVVDIARVTTAEGPATEITLLECAHCDAPYAAAFRRTTTGNWLQVTPITQISTYQPGDIDNGPEAYWRIHDYTDISLNTAHEYVVVAFSTQNYEMLGYWGTAYLPAQTTSPNYILLDEPTPLPELPNDCTTSLYDVISPNDFGMPSDFALPYGWHIYVENYWYSGEPECPMGSDPDIEHLYGSAILSDGFGNEWPIDFLDISLVGGVFTNGRLGTLLAYMNDSGGAYFESYIEQIEFTPTEANVLAELILPNNIKLVDKNDIDTRSRVVVGVFPMATPVNDSLIDFGPTPLSGTNYMVIDENLPWFITPSTIDIASYGIELDTPITTESRDPATPDPNDANNLGYLLMSYSGSNATIDVDGLTGTFSNNLELNYTTSFPAQLHVIGNGIQLQITDSTIINGEINNAQIEMPYLNQEKVVDYITFTDVPTPSERIKYKKGIFDYLGLLPQTLTLTPPDNSLTINQNGHILDTVTLNNPISWTAFSIDNNNALIFITDNSFPDVSSATPRPVVTAWQRYPDPNTPGDHDPGLNINSNSRPFTWDYYGSPPFDAALDIYVRYGGVSENAIVNGDGSTRPNTYGYQEELISFEPLFVDNRLQDQDSQLLTDLYLPYPSATTLPLKVTNTKNGLPHTGTFRDPINPLHDYWRFEHIPNQWHYSPAETADYGATLPTNWSMLFNMRGIATINGLNPPANNLAGIDYTTNISLPLNTEWLPTGDIGNIDILDEFDTGFGGRDYLRTSGVSFALSDIKLSRYYSDPADTNSLPSTANIDNSLDHQLNPLDPDILDGSGNLTPQSLADCALLTNGIGCGFTILDGEGNVDYFGEFNRQTSTMAPSLIPVDDILGDFPIASTNRSTISVKSIIDQPSVHWAWPVANEYIDQYLPGKLILSCYGAVFAYVQPNFELLPVGGLQFVQGDFGAVAKVGYLGSNYIDKVGLFAGYSASQAAFRALATNRPLQDGTCGVLPSDSWDFQLSQDVEDYASKFGYPLTPTPDEDVVDLTAMLWPYPDPQNGNPLPFDQLYQRLEYDITNDTESSTSWIDTDYGLAGLQTGDTISPTGVLFDRGLGQAVFRLPSNGQGIQLDSFFFGTKVDVSTESNGQTETLFKAHRLSMEYSRDGEIKVRGQDVQTDLTGEYDITADFILIIGTKPGYRRIEGGITVDDIKISEVQFRDLGAAFGAGQYSGEIIGYIGLRGEGVWTSFRLGGAILLGKLPANSQALREAGFGTVLDQLDVPGAPPVFIGLYLRVTGDIPVYNNPPIIANGSGTLAFWYFKDPNSSDKTFGGELNASVYATVAKVVSGRGTLGLVIQSLQPGAPNTLPSSVGSWPDLVRTCDNTNTYNPDGENCLALTGSFWIAAGIGNCSPNTWSPWSQRWWSDSWCGQAGAIIGLGYMKMASDGKTWKIAYELDFEKPF